jgi:hypothetical protein
MPSYHAERPHFFEGQYLGADDLTTMLEHARTGDRRHLLGGHTWGIAIGLALKEVTSASGDLEVFLLPGYAWDGYGRPIVVLTASKLPTEELANLPTGAIPIWVEYRESEYEGLRRGFEACDCDDAYTRIRESYRLVIGDKTKLEERQDGITVNGEEVDDAREAFQEADEGALLLCDASVPHQTFPDDADTPRWLVPIGYVSWTAGAPGTLNPLSTSLRKLSRRFRRYTGLVAESVHAADGVLRLGARTTEDDATLTNDAICESLALQDADLSLSNNRLVPKDLVWIEGNLRITGNARLHGTKLEWLNSSGGTDNVELSMQRATNVMGGRDLQVVIGTGTTGANRLAIGLDTTATPPVPKVVITDAGRLGIGTGAPEDAIHIKGKTDPTLKIELDGSAAAAGRVSLRHTGDSGGDLYYDDSSSVDGLVLATVNAGTATERVVITSSGRIGIGTTSPDHDLQVGDGSATVALSLRGPDASTASSSLAFEDTGGKAQHWFRIVHDSQSNKLKIVSAETDPIISFDRTTGRVGIGTASPSSFVHINHDLSGALSVGRGGDSGRIWTAYGNNSPNLVFYDQDDCGGILRFRESPTTNNESTPEYEAIISGRRGKIGIGTTEPKGTLDVRGSIKLGSDGGLFALGGLQNLRVITGQVSDNGSKQLGEGFTSVRTGPGTYRVSYSVSFPSTPVVVVSPVNGSANDNLLTVLNPDRFRFDIAAIDVTPSGEGDSQDTAFTFLALGPRG